MNHTKGPWIAVKYPDVKTWTVGSAKGSIASRVDSEDAARLIAAAPELLESLKEAVENCGCSIKQRYSGHKIECRAPQWIEIIEKVEGK